jgi:exopolyphosphatase / guanosine-5'-triphosphate,3'-diphosphate pyrophosphatase
MVDSLTKDNTQNSSAPSTTEQDRMIAAIDIGTNSVHMVVVRIDPTLPTFTIIAREKETVRLGDRDPKTRDLTPEAMERATRALQRCQDLAKSFNVEQIVAVATSAVREAPNGRAFLKQIEADLGLVVDLISRRSAANLLGCFVRDGIQQPSPHYHRYWRRFYRIDSGG